MGLFHSTYTVSVHRGGGTARAEWDGTVYPFGIDPMWHLASNKMSFFNSFKMKASIVVGVLQMALGIMLSLLNHCEFGDRRAIWFVFVPELVFFLSIFGYLVFMIFLKWSIDWVAIAQQPPSLLNTLISMFMAPGVYTEESRLLSPRPPTPTPTPPPTPTPNPSQTPSPEPRTRPLPLTRRAASYP
jgi:V-type H+-transporting ATPase subunit a